MPSRGLRSAESSDPRVHRVNAASRSTYPSPIVLRYSRSRLTRLAGAIGCASLGATCCFFAQLSNLPQILDYP